MKPRMGLVIIINQGSRLWAWAGAVIMLLSAATTLYIIYLAAKAVGR